MEEEINSVKDAIRERLTSPFLGKFILAWLIWNWKITYVTFFVQEDNIEGNKLEYISTYLKTDCLWDFIIVYIIPLVITATLIWVIPYISHIAFEVSEKFRKKKALRKRIVDDEISGYKDETIINLNKEIKSLNKHYNRVSSNNIELTLLVEYLSEEIKLLNDENYKVQKDVFLEQFKKDAISLKKTDRIVALIDGYNSSFIRNNYFMESEENERNFLLKSGLIETHNNHLILSDFGKYISKNRLYKKYNLND